MVRKWKWYMLTYRPLYPELAHNPFKVARNYRSLAFQVVKGRLLQAHLLCGRKLLEAENVLTAGALEHRVARSPLFRRPLRLLSPH